MTSPIAKGFFVFVCVCLFACVRYFLSHRTYFSDNQKYKNGLCNFGYLPSNGLIAKNLLRDLDLHFRFQMFKIREIRLFSYVAEQIKL